VRAISLALIGPEKALALRLAWEDWLSIGQRAGHIKLMIAANEWDRTVDTRKASVKALTTPVPVELDFSLEKVWRGEDFKDSSFIVVLDSNINAKTRSPRKEVWSDYSGWFSAAYGPFRRFTGGNPEWNKLFYSSPKVGAHLSAFGEDVALTEALEWLRDKKLIIRLRVPAIRWNTSSGLLTRADCCRTGRSLTASKQMDPFFWMVIIMLFP
jgi:hypothetical protein